MKCLGAPSLLLWFRVMYNQASRLLAELKEVKSEVKYHKTLLKILKTDLVILDDFGLSSFTNESRLALLDILEDRHDRISTVFI